MDDIIRDNIILIIRDDDTAMNAVDESVVPLLGDDESTPLQKPLLFLLPNEDETSVVAFAAHEHLGLRYFAAWPNCVDASVARRALSFRMSFLQAFHPFQMTSFKGMHASTSQKGMRNRG